MQLRRFAALHNGVLLLLLVPFLCITFFRDLEDLSTYHVDETIWIPYGNQIFQLYFIHHDFSSPFWQDDFYSYGAYNPPIGKYLIGFGTYSTGYDAIYYKEHYNWQQTIEWNNAQGNIYEPALLRAARWPVALLGLLGCVCLYWLVSLVFNGWYALMSVLALLGGQFYLRSSRAAMLDIPGVAFVLLAYVCLWYLVAALRAERLAATCGWASACGLALGLAVGTKLTGGLALIACVLVLLLEWVQAVQQKRAAKRFLPCMLVIGTLATALFVASNPFLYPDPVAGMKHMLSFTTIMSKTTGAFAPFDGMGKLKAVAENMVLFAPLRQLGATGDAVVLLLGLIALGARCATNWRACWQQQISTLLVCMLVSFVGITLWLPIAWARYSLPLQPWSAFIYAYGIVWLARYAWRWLNDLWNGRLIMRRTG